MDTGQWKGEGREGRKGGRVDGDGGARFLSSDARAIFSIREINMSNDFDLNRVPFPLICLMGEVAGYAGWGRRGGGMLFITILIARLHEPSIHW